MVDFRNDIERFLQTPGASLMIMGEKGGVGKTFIMEAVLAWCAAQGIKPTIIEFDEGARLQDMYGRERCHFFKIHKTSLKQLERKPRLLYEMWDEAMKAARQSKTFVVFDFGSNTFTPFCDYINQQQGRGFFGKGENNIVFGVTTGNKKSLDAVQVAMGYAKQVFHASRHALIINDCDPNSRVDEDSDAMEILAKKCECPTFYLPDVGAPDALSYGIEKAVPLETLALKGEAFWEDVGLLPDAAIRTVLRIENYMLEAGAIFEEMAVSSVSTSGSNQ